MLDDDAGARKTLQSNLDNKRKQLVTLCKGDSMSVVQKINLVKTAINELTADNRRLLGT